jgi:photosystem II stability/assembly factor-like uncharacterized protein
MRILLAALLCAGSARALTVDEVLARNTEARGGLVKIKAIKSVRATGKALFGGDEYSVEAGFAQVQKRPGMVRNETTLQGLTAVEAWDGAEGWAMRPFDGRKDPQRQSADDAKSLAQDGDLEGPLVDSKAKGHRVEYLGTEDVDGTPAHKLRVSLKDGDVEYLYLDPDSFLEIRAVIEHHVRGTEHVSEVDIGSYGQVAGVWFPFSYEIGRKGAPRHARYSMQRIEVNVAADDSLFHYPGDGARVARAIVTDGKSGTGPAGAARPAPRGAPVLDSGVISGLGARNIGSAAMSGRISALAARNQDGKTLIYAAAASGGVWKSMDGGTTFKPVFDKQAVQSIGAVALDPSNPKTVWVGSGEAWTRNSTSVGDGIYKSTDAGETWTHMGLPESERIARIVVHPRDGNIVWACVPGKLWSDSADRGLYKTSDGGRTWALVLKGGNLSTGCSGLSLDPKNPDVLFAGLWDFRRKGWTFRSGGEGPDAPSGSGLYRTSDGGTSWKEVTQTLPARPWGRVEVAIAPSNPQIVYSFIESKDPALYRSADGGATWEKRDKSQAMVWRPFYFARLVVDPTNPDRVFKPNYSLVASEDGGRSFTRSGGGAHGDWHDLWIDPENPRHVIGGDDGGLWISHDGGNRWWKGNNLPVSQFYHVSLDDKDPYQVYGGLQDNSSWVGDSARPGGVTNAAWENLYGGDGFWTLVDPGDPDAVYAESQGGFIGRIDRRTRAVRDIQPKAGYHEKLRFNWNAPIHASATQKGTIYIGAQFLFRSRDRGDTWERISPDLSTNDPEKQKQEQSGGITVDNSSAEMHTTIYSISESPLDANVIWVGTDDGNVQLTRDGGKSWTKLEVTGLPRASWVSWVEASRHDPATAYATFDRHTFGDLTPWVYRTTDFGRTWVRMAQGVRGYAHVIKEDVVSRSLLFLGTELGLWISLDDGKSWAEFKGGNFPSVAVREVQVHPRDHDLVIATHGRGIWIIDDISPLRALSSEVLARDAAFLGARPVQQRMGGVGGWVEGDASFVGATVPTGAAITWYQRTRHMFGPIRLEILDADGKVIDTVSPTKRRGLNRVTWSMQTKPPRVPRAAQVAQAGSQGPRVMPGAYQVRLVKGGESFESKLEIALDRRAPYTLADRKANFDASMRVHALFGDMSTLMDRIEGAKSAAEARVKSVPAGDPLAARLQALVARLDEVRRKIVATKEGGAVTGEERIREHADQLYGALLTWEGKPGKYQIERIDVLRRELDDVRSEYDAVVAAEIRPLDHELRTRKLEPIPSEGGPTAQLEGEVPKLAAECALSRGMDCELPERAALRDER